MEQSGAIRDRVNEPDFAAGKMHIQRELSAATSGGAVKIDGFKPRLSWPFGRRKYYLSPLQNFHNLELKIPPVTREIPELSQRSNVGPPVFHAAPVFAPTTNFVSTDQRPQRIIRLLSAYGE